MLTYSRAATFYRILSVYKSSTSIESHEVRTRVLTVAVGSAVGLSHRQRDLLIFKRNLNDFHGDMRLQFLFRFKSLEKKKLLIILLPGPTN